MAETKKLARIHFETNRTLDFLSRKELIAQTGHQVAEWPLVCLKELVDNALDACEESGVAPRLRIRVDEAGISVTDNGPGIPASVIDSTLDFSVRVSSREAYVSPCRGAQGNALKTIVAMPFALCGEGAVVIESRGARHEVRVTVDRVRQVPKIDHQMTEAPATEGTSILVPWPDSPRLDAESHTSDFLQVRGHAGTHRNTAFANSPTPRSEGQPLASPRSILWQSRLRFLQIAEDYCWLNPHLSLDVDWDGETMSLGAFEPGWKKWLPSNPTDPHWYGADELERLIAANICHQDRPIRELIAEFRGLSGSAKQKKVLEETGLARTQLSELVIDGAISRSKVIALLSAMKSQSQPVKPAGLGIIGEKHLRSRCEQAGGDVDSFRYKKVAGTDNGTPWVVETCFAYCPEETRRRRIITGVNWSPGIINPFRQLGTYGKSLDSILEEQRAGRDEPTILVLHIACPKVQYSDRGKSSVIVEE